MRVPSWLRPLAARLNRPCRGRAPYRPAFRLGFEWLEDGLRRLGLLGFIGDFLPRTK
jgi:hypothetical protein